ncbi:MAG: aminotransferase class III-fold pyridoxal phosphate-dependent enzyme [Anaerolineales bacterium]
MQTGMGRTGKLWGVNHWNIEPDIIATAKSLGGGVMPVSAVTTTEEIFKPMMCQIRSCTRRPQAEAR